MEKNLETLKRVGFKKSDIIFVTGFKSSLIKRKTKNFYSYVHNRNFKITNMVFSFYEVIKKYNFQIIIYFMQIYI
jgi:choline kinase